MKKLLIVSLISVVLPLSAVTIYNRTDKDFLLKGEKRESIKIEAQGYIYEFPLKKRNNVYSFTAQDMNKNKTYTFELEHPEYDIKSIDLKLKNGNLIAFISARRGAKFEDYVQEAK